MDYYKIYYRIKIIADYKEGFRTKLFEKASYDIEACRMLVTNYKAIKDNLKDAKGVYGVIAEYESVLGERDRLLKMQLINLREDHLIDLY